MSNPHDLEITEIRSSIKVSWDPFDKTFSITELDYDRFARIKLSKKEMEKLLQFAAVIDLQSKEESDKLIRQV